MRGNPNKEEGWKSPANPSLYSGDCRLIVPLSNREGETARPVSQKTCLNVVVQKATSVGNGTMEPIPA